MRCGVDPDEWMGFLRMAQRKSGWGGKLYPVAG